VGVFVIDAHDVVARAVEQPGGTVHPQPSVRDLVEAVQQVVQRDVQRTGDVTGRPFVVAAHVENDAVVGCAACQVLERGDRVASGSRTAPQRRQGTAAWRAKQLRQIRLPSSSFESAFT
jgi:hypothetical protein